MDFFQFFLVFKFLPDPRGAGHVDAFQFMCVRAQVLLGARGFFGRARVLWAQTSTFGRARVPMGAHGYFLVCVGTFGCGRVIFGVRRYFTARAGTFG